MSSDEDEDREESSDAVESDDAGSEAGGAEAAPQRDEGPELPSSESRRKLREQLQAEMDAFLKRGGRIEVLESATGAQGNSITAGVNDLSQ